MSALKRQQLEQAGFSEINQNGFLCWENENYLIVEQEADTEYTVYEKLFEDVSVARDLNGDITLMQKIFTGQLTSVEKEIKIEKENMLTGKTEREMKPKLYNNISAAVAVCKAKL